MQARNEYHAAVMDQKESEKEKIAETYDAREQMIQNQMEAELLGVKEGSIEELRIRAKYAKDMIDLQKERLNSEKQNYFENQEAVIDSKKKYRKILLDIEKQITEDLVDESEKRIAARERALAKEAAEIQRDVLTGEATEEQAEIQLAENRVQFIRRQITEKNRLISQLGDQKNAEEEINETIADRKELEVELMEAQNEELQARLNQIEALAGRQQELADLRKDAAVAGIEQEKERFKITESNKTNVLGYIEKEKNLEYETLQAKLEAEKAHRQATIDSYKAQMQSYIDLLGEQKAKELYQYKKTELQKLEYARKSQQAIIELQEQVREARIRAQGTSMEQIDFGIEKFFKDYREQSKDMVDYAYDMASTISEAGKSAFKSWIDGSKKGKEAFKDFVRSIIDQMADMLADSVTKQFMNLLGAMWSGGTSGGGISGFLSSLWHRGGVVGVDDAEKRIVSPSLFDSAKKLHDGLSGLSASEYPAILKKGEIVFTQGQLAALGEVFKSAMENESSKNNTPPNVEIRLENRSGKNVDAKQKGQPRLEKDKWVMDVILDAANRNKNNFGKNLKGALQKA